MAVPSTSSPSHSGSTPAASPALQTLQCPPSAKSTAPIITAPASQPQLAWPMPVVAANPPSSVIATSPPNTHEQQQQRTSYYRPRPNQTDASGKSNNNTATLCTLQTDKPFDPRRMSMGSDGLFYSRLMIEHRKPNEKLFLLQCWMKNCVHWLLASLWVWKENTKYNVRASNIETNHIFTPIYLEKWQLDGDKYGLWGMTGMSIGGKKSSRNLPRSESFQAKITLNFLH